MKILLLLLLLCVVGCFSFCQKVHLYFDQEAKHDLKFQNQIVEKVENITEGFLNFCVTRTFLRIENKKNLPSFTLLVRFNRGKVYKSVIGVFITDADINFPNFQFGVTSFRNQGCSKTKRSAIVYHDNHVEKISARISVAIASLYGVRPSFAWDPPYINAAERYECGMTTNSLTRQYYWRKPYNFVWTPCAVKWRDKFFDYQKRCLARKKCRRRKLKSCLHF